MPLRFQVQHVCVLLWSDFSRGISHMLISNINSPLCGSDGSNPKSVIIHMDSFPQYAAAKSLQSCLTLCDPIDSSPLGSPVPGILQARTLEWVPISFSSAWKWKVKVKLLSRVQLLATHGLQPSKLLCPWDFPGKSTGVGCHCLLRNIHECRLFSWAQIQSSDIS